MKDKVISGFFWRFGERVGAKLVALIVEIVLARILAPEAYGTITLITVFTTILQVFVDSGLGNALIQKKNADDLDFSSVFYFNMAFCLILYAIVFFCAPLIANFYNDITLVPLIRVLSITIVLSGIKNVEQAYVSKNMLFKKFFFATLGGTIGAAVVGITMALNGYGVWALVCQHLFNTLVDTIILYIIVKWRPKLMFSWKRLKELFKYGWKLLASSLLDTIYNDLRQLIIGKKYTSSDLAFFDKGKKFPDIITTNINASIDSVLLPTMSKEQEDKEKVKKMTRRAIKTSTFIMMPLMIGLMVCAEPFVKLILTDKWLPCVPYLRIFCFTYSFYPIHTANLNAIKAMGRSDIFLKLEIIKKIIDVTLLIITMNISVMAMGYSLMVSSILSQIINSYPNKKLLNYSYFEQLKDILPQIIISIIMGIVVYLISLINVNVIVILIMQVISGGIIYIGLSKLFKVDSYEYVLDTIKNIIKKKKKVSEV